jgi:hypothetical protein
MKKPARIIIAVTPVKGAFHKLKVYKNKLLILIILINQAITSLTDIRSIKIRQLDINILDMALFDEGFWQNLKDIVSPHDFFGEYFLLMTIR